jgi:hypothetical protein
VGRVHGSREGEDQGGGGGVRVLRQTRAACAGLTAAGGRVRTMRWCRNGWLLRSAWGRFRLGAPAARDSRDRCYLIQWASISNLLDYSTADFFFLECARCVKRKNNCYVICLQSKRNKFQMTEAGKSAEHNPKQKY